VLYRATSVLSSRYDVSIFVLPTKLVENVLKRCRTVLCFAHMERVSMVVAVCYDRGMGRDAVLSYECFKFMLRCVDFCAPDKIGQIGAETS